MDIFIKVWMRVDGFYNVPESKDPRYLLGNNMKQSASDSARQ